MQKNFAAICCIASFLFIFSCNRRHAPQHTAAATPSGTAPATAKKPAVKKVTTPVPRVIAVNDNVAKKNIDGRLYYDLNGHRYWRNYNDGKYYLFNSSMYSDSAFIPH